MPDVLIDLRSSTRADIAADPNPGMGLFLDQGQIWLGPWQWHTLPGPVPHWAAPLVIDPLGGNYSDLGSDPLARMPVAARNALADRLGLSRSSLPDTSLADLLAYYILGTLADPTGLNRVKPLRMDQRGLELYLGSPSAGSGRSFGRVIAEPLSTNHPNFQATLDVRWEDYIRNREAGVPLEALQRWTGYDALKLFGREPTASDLDALLPPQYRADGWQRPRTTIGDTFVEGANTNLESHTATGANGGFGWAAVNGSFNVLEATDDVNVDSGTGTLSHFRAASDLSSADHHAQLDITALGSGTDNVWFGAAARYNSANSERYTAFLYQFNDNIYLARYSTGGTETIITNTGVTLSLPDAVKVEISGSTLRAYFNGAEALSVTDTNITGNLRTGINAWRNAAVSQKGDNFEAADLAVGGFSYSQAVIVG